MLHHVYVKVKEVNVFCDNLILNQSWSCTSGDGAPRKKYEAC